MRKLAAVAVFVIVGLIAPAAHAAVLMMGRDRSDNGIYFVYDSETRSIPEYGSATGPIDGRFDRVSFMVGVGTTPPEETAPLAGIISLRLRGKKAVRYEGTFVIRVSDEAGARAATVKIPVARTLRPQPGKRRATLTKTFTVPDGFHTADAVFRPAPLAPPDQPPP